MKKLIILVTMILSMTAGVFGQLTEYSLAFRVPRVVGTRMEYYGFRDVAKVEKLTDTIYIYDIGDLFLAGAMTARIQAVYNTQFGVFMLWFRQEEQFITEGVTVYANDLEANLMDLPDRTRVHSWLFNPQEVSVDGMRRLGDFSFLRVQMGTEFGVRFTARTTFLYSLKDGLEYLNAELVRMGIK